MERDDDADARAWRAVGDWYHAAFTGLILATIVHRGTPVAAASGPSTSQAARARASVSPGGATKRRARPAQPSGGLGRSCTTLTEKGMREA